MRIGAIQSQGRQIMIPRDRQQTIDERLRAAAQRSDFKRQFQAGSAFLNPFARVSGSIAIECFNLQSHVGGAQQRLTRGAAGSYLHFLNQRLHPGTESGRQAERPPKPDIGDDIGIGCYRKQDIHATSAPRSGRQCQEYVIGNRNVDRGLPLVTLRPAKWCCFDLAQIPAEIAALLCTTKAQPDSSTFHLAQGYPIRANVPATRPKKENKM